MIQQHSPLIDSILRLHFASIEHPLPRLPWAQVETLLVDDSDRRMSLGRRLATTPHLTDDGPSRSTVVGDCLLVTERGLIYLTRLGSVPRPTSVDPETYYVATPAALFDPFVDYVKDCALRLTCFFTVDGRLDAELRAPRASVQLGRAVRRAPLAVSFLSYSSQARAAASPACDPRTTTTRVTTASATLRTMTHQPTCRTCFVGERSSRLAK